nr:MAG TPA: hypothetical protein [Caudoviricetes sp.]
MAHNREEEQNSADLFSSLFFCNNVRLTSE